MQTEEQEIERRQTGVRALLTLLFLVISRVVGSVLFLTVLFELLFTAITKSPPPERVRQFANRVVTYLYRMGRYVTYAETAPPFPFSEFPEEVEPLPSIAPDSVER